MFWFWFWVWWCRIFYSLWKNKNLDILDDKTFSSNLNSEAFSAASYLICVFERNSTSRGNTHTFLLWGHTANCYTNAPHSDMLIAELSFFLIKLHFQSSNYCWMCCTAKVPSFYKYIIVAMTQRQHKVFLLHFLSNFYSFFLIVNKSSNCIVGNVENN